MSMHFSRWPKRFGVIYGIALTAFTAYVLLDTFVIPKALTVVDTGITSESKADSSVSESDSDTAFLQSEASYQAAVSDSTSSKGSTGDQSTDSTDDTVSSPVITDTSYDDGNISITIDTERINDTTCYIADIQISDISYLKAAFAEDTYGRNIKETTSDMAQEHNAVLAINGDYYGFRDYGYVLRNSVLYRDTSGNDEDLVIDADGTMRIIEESETSASELEDEGVWQVLSFGPALMEDGEITGSEDEEVAQSMTSNPRTAIGMISPLHYIIVVSDGRTQESAGLTLYELAEVFQSRGASVAYNLDGGGSSTLWFNGEVINNPAGGRHNNKERAVSDILYIG